MPGLVPFPGSRSASIRVARWRRTIYTTGSGRDGPGRRQTNDCVFGLDGARLFDVLERCCLANVVGIVYDASYIPFKRNTSNGLEGFHLRRHQKPSLRHCPEKRFDAISNYDQVQLLGFNSSMGGIAHTCL